MAIFERDKFTCQICGNKGLEIHHKDKWQENNDPDNLILLCKDCHKKEHQND
jgi:5-methylcytosine-specific restriction endonuclease McrA